jgi:histidyl-tRNA synthetase
MLGLLFGAGALSVSRSVPTCVLVAVPDERDRSRCDRVAATLRRRGIATEVSPSAAKFGKQIRHAQRRGIPFVWFPGALDVSVDLSVDRADGPGTIEGTNAGAGEVKDIRSGEQITADAARWTPPEADLHPRVTAASPAAEPPRPD